MCKNSSRRTPRPEKIDFPGLLSTKGQEMSLGPYDKIKNFLDSHPESSHMCKNSSRRTPRPKNLIFLVF